MAKEDHDRLRGKAQVQREGSSEINLVIENSVALQKVVADLAVNLKKFSKEVSEMLQLFKDATKTISGEKTEEEVKGHNFEELNAKMEELISQNKTIAKGILLLESSMSKENYSR